MLWVDAVDIVTYLQYTCPKGVNVKLRSDFSELSTCLCRCVYTIYSEHLLKEHPNHSPLSQSRNDLVQRGGERNLNVAVVSRTCSPREPIYVNKGVKKHYMIAKFKLMKMKCVNSKSE